MAAHVTKLNAVKQEDGSFEVHARFPYDGFKNPVGIGTVVRSGAGWVATNTYGAYQFEVSGPDMMACLSAVRAAVDDVDARFAQEEDDWVDVDALTERAIENANDQWAWGQSELDRMHGM